MIKVSSNRNTHIWLNRIPKKTIITPITNTGQETTEYQFVFLPERKTTAINIIQHQVVETHKTKE